MVEMLREQKEFEWASISLNVVQRRNKEACCCIHCLLDRGYGSKIFSFYYK